jgi:hypothetical protein
LKDLKIFVPEAVIMGNAATLSCQYDLGDVSVHIFSYFAIFTFKYLLILSFFCCCRCNVNSICDIF